MRTVFYHSLFLAFVGFSTAFGKINAKHSIVLGNLVTPTTDPGDYIVEANGKLTLKAGDEIVLKSGVHFKAGSTVHIKPEYDECNDQKSGQITDNGTDETGDEKEVTYLNNRTEKIALNSLYIFQNFKLQQI